MAYVLRSLYHDRRRIALVAALTYAGGHIAFHDREGQLFGLPFAIVAGLSFMAGLTLVLVTIGLIFQGSRNTAECAALAIPVLSLMGAFGSGNGLSAPFFVFAILFCYLAMVFYGGTWLDRFLPRRTRSFTTTVTTKLSPEAIWPYFAVTPDTAAEARHPSLLDVSWITPGTTLKMEQRHGDMLKIEEHQTIKAFVPQEQYQFRFDVPDATDAAPIKSGMAHIRLSPTKAGTAITTERTFERMSVRARLFLWIDDAFGRKDSETVARAEADAAA